MASDSSARKRDDKLSEPQNEENCESYNKDETESVGPEASSGASSAGLDQDEPRKDDSLTVVADLINAGKAKNVIFLLGAGISTSAGIPDFRSPSTGLYHNLQSLKLPFPEAVFELGFFQKRPEPFWTLAKEIYPGKHFPTPSHYLLELFNRHKLVKRVFTQNIDTLETIAGLPSELIVEAHGSFATSHCLKCHRSVDREEVLDAGVREGRVVRCSVEAKSGKKCGGLVKPDIVFFGEGLPDRFFELIPELRKCDLLIVIGTSLQVQPFASLVDYVQDDCPRLLINREPVGPFARTDTKRSSVTKATSRLRASDRDARDMYYEGDADDGAWRLADELGWAEELRQMLKEGRKKLEREWASQGKAVAVEGTIEAEKKAKDASKALKKEVKGDDLEEAVEKLKL